MALNDIENKKLGFYTTVTNNPVDATMLPVIYKKTGNLIISYSEVDKEETPHIWLGGEHVASGYGQNKYKDKQNLSYISLSYNICWNFVTELDQYSPFLLNNEYRAAVLKDSNSQAFSSYTLIIGEDSFISNYSNNSTILGNNNKLKGQSSVSIGSFNTLRSSNSFIAGTYIETPISENQFILGIYPYVSNDTAFAFGNGVSRRNKSNVIEISKAGDLYIKGIGLKDDKNRLYNGSNLNEGPQSFQSYISSSLSYNISFAKRYTDDNIANLIGGAPDALNSLKEIADYISDINSEFNDTFIPVPDYNKLNSSQKYYYNRRDIKINIDNPSNSQELKLFIEKILREAWDAGKRTFEEISNYFNDNGYYREEPNPYENHTILNERILKNFYIDSNNGIYIYQKGVTENPDNLIKDNNNLIEVDTKLEIEGNTVWNEVKSLYNFLNRYEETSKNIVEIYNDHINTGLIYYYKENQTSLISSVHQIQSSYIINNGTAKSNVSYTWVASLGETTYLNTILDALLERPIYTRPELKLKNLTTIYEVGTNVAPTVEFDFGDSIRNPELVNYNNITTNENLGYSYSFQDNNILKGFQFEIYSTLNGLKELTGNINTTYTFGNLLVEEKDYEMITYIKYNYTYATYMFYPQLLANINRAYVVCHDGWFGNEHKYCNTKYIISGKYKYYYGWDNIPDNSGSDIISKAGNNYGWLDKTGTKTVQVPFTSNHSKFWFACPYTLYSQTNIGNNYFILYKTSIGEQDLISNTVNYSQIITTNTVSVCGLKYIIYTIDFNRQYIGESTNYLKFNIKRL